MADFSRQFARIREMFGITAYHLDEARIFITKLDRDADFTQVEAEEKTLNEAETALQDLEREVKRLQRAEARLSNLMDDYGRWIESSVRRYCGWTDADIDRADGEPAMLAAIEAALARCVPPDDDPQS